MLIYEFGSLGSRTRIQKMFYLMKHKYHVLIPFFFSTHLYGPYSSEISSTIFSLVNKNLIEEKKINAGYSYKLTNAGFFLVKTSCADLPSNVAKTMRKLKDEGYGSKNLTELLDEVYQIAGIKK